jgi:hypothetical protein
MFLWIFEKQEEYQPINQSTMLENFIERLFKKHSNNEEYFKSFDYKNKESLLSVIAMKMFNEERENYSLKFSDLLDICADHLHKRKFNFDPERIINQFINVGLMVKYLNDSESYIRFRFNCFFQYFLMKNMDDNNFYEYIKKEENYLSFSEEIILFTGIKRNRNDLLALLVDRMKILYKDILDDINKLPEGFDSFFEVNLTYTEQLNDGFIEHIGDNREAIKKEVNILTDKMLETIKPNESVQKKESSLTNFQKLEKCWQLVANVLRNTEETDIENLKYNSYKDILASSFCFVCLYKFLYVNYLKKIGPELGKEERTDAELTLQFLPILHESLINDVLSSEKLSLVYKEHIDAIINDKTKTQLEKFCAVFLYADIRGNKFIDYIKRFIAQIKGKYISDMTLFKILGYYYLRSDTHDSDKEYENIIADLIIVAKGYSKRIKSTIISNYKKRKKNFISEKQETSLL